MTVARKPRIQYEGAAYHVMSRGNGGADIFFGDRDRSLFVDTLDEACSRCAWQIHAFVLMRNHYHFLLVTPHANLVEGMKWFQGTFTQRFNARHQRRGHLFQGRYRAQNIDWESQSEERYFRAVANYIHLNPARARLLGRGGARRPLSTYRWSSLPLYLGAKRKRPNWLGVQAVLAEHELADTPGGRRAYAAWLEEIISGESGAGGRAGEEYRDIRLGWFLGGDRFGHQLREKVGAMLKKTLAGSLDGAAVKAVDEQKAARIMKACTRALGMKESDWAALKKTDLRKGAVVWVLKRETCVRNDWIRRELSMGHPTNVSNAARQFRENRTRETDALRKQLAKVEF